MKYLLLVSLVATTALVSCSKNKKSGLIGEWQLIETLMDPGDGSGTFEPVVSDKRVTFCTNGNFSSNGTMCYPDPSIDNATSGTFNVDDQTLNVEANCGFAPVSISYEIVDDYLIVSYSCFEACQEKYEKL